MQGSYQPNISSKKVDPPADVEQQNAHLVESEFTAATTKKYAYLGVYFLCNIALTIYNKLVLGKVDTLCLSVGVEHGS